MKFLMLCLGILAAAFLGQYGLALLAPNLIMEVLYNRGGDFGYNTMVVAPRPDESMRQIVRPSPDLLYARCIYNLKQGPLEIEAPVPDRYWSMQFYQMNTDNYAGITNQRDEAYRVGTLAKVTLVGPGESNSNPSGDVLVSPTQRGIIILRVSAIGDESDSRAALTKSSCAIL